MEITRNGLLAVIIPALITACFTTIDNSLRWRAEMEQKQFDRQTKILDQIINIPDAARRRAMAEFYVSTGVFTGGYKDELTKTLDIANAELAQQAAQAAQETTKQQRQEEREQAILSAPIPMMPLPEELIIDFNSMYDPPTSSTAPAVIEPPTVEQKEITITPSIQNIFLLDDIKRGTH